VFGLHNNDLSMNVHLDSAITAERNMGGSLLTKCPSSCVSSGDDGPFNIQLASYSAICPDMPSCSSVSSVDEEVFGITVSSSQDSADDSLSMIASNDTSAVRKQLSCLQCESVLKQPTDNYRQAKSASDNILLRKSSTYAIKPMCSSPPKPKVQKLRRRKQEFDQLLRTPPDDYRENARRRTGVKHHRSSADSGFGSFSESAVNAASESEMKFLADDAMIHSQTPPLQLRVRTPVNDAAEMVESSSFSGDVDKDEDINMMLFTPFKVSSGAGTELVELSPDIELSASIVAGSDCWVSFTPISVGFRARTSTPCQLLGGAMSVAEHVGNCGNSDSRPPRLSHLLTEFEDNSGGLCSLDAVTDMQLGGDPASSSLDVLTFDDTAELDLSFDELR